MGTSAGCGDARVTGGVSCGQGVGDPALSLSGHSPLCQRSCSPPPPVPAMGVYLLTGPEKRGQLTQTENSEMVTQNELLAS